MWDGSFMNSNWALNAQLLIKMLTALFSQPLSLLKPCMSFIFPNILAEYDMCSPLLYQHCSEKKVAMKLKMLLSSRRTQPPVDCL